MSQVFASIASTNLGTPAGTYIYDIVSTNGLSTSISPLASITSNNTLTIFDPSTLSTITSIKNIHDADNGGVTCVQALNENVLLTAGRDGVVNLWDIRNGSTTRKVGNLCRVENPSQRKPFLSLAASSTYNAIAAGEEYSNYTARMAVWDIRNNSSSPTRQYTESHNDDITEIKFDESSVSNLVLSGSTDGLVNIYDLNSPKQSSQNGGRLHTEEVEDDEEALYQIINHGSSIHHAGFLPQSLPDKKSLFAISHDETLTVYEVNNQHDIDRAEEEDAKPDEKCAHGDLRERIKGCDYVVNLVMSDRGNPLLIAGSNKGEKNWVNVIPFRNKTGEPATTWDPVLEDGIKLDGAHGEEVVRCIKVFEKAGTIFTGGEDGLVKVWRGPGNVSEEIEKDKGEEIQMTSDNDGEVSLEKSEKRRRKKHIEKQKDKQRYKPY